MRLSVRIDDQILEETCVRIPQRYAAIDMSRDGVGDRQELRKGLDGDAFVIGIFGCELEGDHRHVEREHRHPAGGVRLLQTEARRQWLGAGEDGDVVEAEKAALEDIMPVPVLAIDPPGIVQQQLLEHPVQEMKVSGAALYPLSAKDLERGRRVDRRIYVAESPFISRDLAIWMQIPLAQQDFDLVFGEVDIDECQRAAMKSEVPSGKPWIFPAVGHRDDIAGFEVLPIAVAAAEAALWRAQFVAFEPAFDIVVEKLLAPDHPGERLPQYAVVVGTRLWQQLIEEDVGLLLPLRTDGLVAGEWGGEGLGRQHQVELCELAGGNV